MARTKQRKVGDRIFYEYYDGTIGTAIIKKIEDAEYKESQGYGKPDALIDKTFAIRMAVTNKIRFIAVLSLFSAAKVGIFPSRCSR